MDVMQAATAAEAAGRHIIHMEVGQPGTGAPSGAARALSSAMAQGPLGYTVALGLPALRARIARMYGEWYNVDLDPSRVVITSGSSAGFILAFTALFDSGDRVGIGAPGYPSYRQILGALGMVPVDLPSAVENRYQPVPADFEAMDLRGLLVASPANPTGTMLDHAAMKEDCADKMARYDIRPPNPRLPARNFSGGNQQKIVVAREMDRAPDLLLIGQPTRGVDIGAIEFIHKQIIALRDEGKAILLISVELDEIMGLSDRIAVMFDGRLMGERLPSETDQNELGLMMAGVTEGAA
jgi:hypothetical protein